MEAPFALVFRVWTIFLGLIPVTMDGTASAARDAPAASDLADPRGKNYFSGS
jgi:hypothetical protein